MRHAIDTAPLAWLNVQGSMELVSNFQKQNEEYSKVSNEDKNAKENSSLEQQIHTITIKN